jgi:hypothetical protein
MLQCKIISPFHIWTYIMEKPKTVHEHKTELTFILTNSFWCSYVQAHHKILNSMNGILTEWSYEQDMTGICSAQRENYPTRVHVYK